jgi:MFS family permease
MTDILIELSYVFFSLVLTSYSLWAYLGRKEKPMLYLTLCFAFLTSSMTLLFLNSFVWFPATRITIRLIEIAGLGLFAGFAIFLVIALVAKLR